MITPPVMFFTAGTFFEALLVMAVLFPGPVAAVCAVIAIALAVVGLMRQDWRPK